MKRLLCLSLLACCVLASACVAQTSTTKGSHYLFVWAGDAARKNTDFLSVIGADPASPDYGRVIATVPVKTTGNMPHHTEYEFPADNQLFAEGWATGTTYIFDLANPAKPRLAQQFKALDGYIYPHSFVRLPNGHVLGTFQAKGSAFAPPGGLVEMDDKGAVVRASAAFDRAVSLDCTWPYSMAVDKKLDRVIVSSTPMSVPDWMTLPPGSWPSKKINDAMTWHVQVWRLSDLKLLSTIALPEDAGHHHMWPAEPRLLSDGSQYVNTFNCGLYRLHDVAGSHPAAKLVYTFPGGGMDMNAMCAVPVVVGDYWVQTVGSLPGLVALDVTNPDKPVEVSRLKLDPKFARPHWLAADRKGDRLVMTGDGNSWVLMARINPKTGALSLDDSFREPGARSPGVSFDRASWPHGDFGKAIVHGALFGPE